MFTPPPVTSATIATVEGSAFSTVESSGGNGRDIGEMSATTVQCPELTADDWALIDRTAFWAEGILQTGVSVVGIVSNVIFSLILLSKRELRNSFNLLLVALACFDSAYLLGAILDSVRRSFRAASALHIELFPHFIYPLHAIALTGSIFLTVGIAFERYIAVHNPINYNRAMNDARATRSRVLKFLVPVLLGAVMFSVPKFFESVIEYRMDASTNRTTPHVMPTPLRMDPTYARYITWMRLAVQSVFPVGLLIYFNRKIYRCGSEVAKILALVFMINCWPLSPGKACYENNWKRCTSRSMIGAD